MIKRIHPVVKATLLAPLVIVPVSFVICLLISGGELLSFDATEDSGSILGDLFSVVWLYSYGGLMISYPTLLVIGLPLYHVAKWFGCANYTGATVGALLACVPAAFLGNGSAGMAGYLFAVCFGVPIACLFVKIANQGEAEKETGKAPTR